jgi:L-asparagine transporter-like permease
MIYRISLSSTILYFLTGLLLCCGWIILCSAANGNADEWANKQLYTALITLILSFFAAFIPGDVVGDMSSIGTLFAFILVCAGVIILRKTEPNLKRQFKTPLVPLVPILGIIFCTVMILGLGSRISVPESLCWRLPTLR